MAYNTGTYTLLGIGGTTTGAVNPGQTVTFNLVGVASTFDVSSAPGSVVTVNDGIGAASTINADTNGGTIMVGSLVGASTTVNATIDMGGTFIANSQSSGGATTLGLLDGGNITFGTGGGKAVFGVSNSFLNLSVSPVIENYTPGNMDMIEDESFDYSTFSSYTIGAPDGSGNQVITLTDSTGTSTFTVHPVHELAAGTYAPTTGPLAFQSDGNGGTEIVCFLEGTSIATASGERAVEDLKTGDIVILADGSHGAVKWVGHRSLDLRNARNPERLYPVRIRQDAFAPNVPQRDLLITQEHCILVDGGLIPARMLVNGRSIILDRSIEQFTYYHVELEQHGILLAENLPAESYLDTGNRGNFANTDTVAILPDLTVNGTHQSWASAAAPLTVDQADVEPVWRMLDARAQELGIAPLTAQPDLTSDPDLRVVTGNGAVIRPIRNMDGRYLFMLPAGAADLRLLSNTARPSETVGPFIDDRRELGVLVGEIAVHHGRRKLQINSHLASDDLPGWFGAEPAASHRWTNGNARLPATPAQLAAWSVILEIQLVQAGPYKVAAEGQKTAIAA